MNNATVTTSGLATFCCLDDLGLVLTGQHLTPERAVLLCCPTAPDEWCHRCSGHGRVRDTITRELAHVPFCWRTTTLTVRLPRYQCTGCGHVWSHDLTRAASPHSCLSRGALRWALEALVVIDLTPVSTGTGASRLPAMVEGHSKHTFTTWLAARHLRA